MPRRQQASTAAISAAERRQRAASRRRRCRDDAACRRPAAEPVIDRVAAQTAKRSAARASRSSAATRPGLPPPDLPSHLALTTVTLDSSSSCERATSCRPRRGPSPPHSTYRQRLRVCTLLAPLGPVSVLHDAQCHRSPARAPTAHATPSLRSFHAAADTAASTSPARRPLPRPHPDGCSTNEKYALTSAITRMPVMISVREPMM